MAYCIVCFAGDLPVLANRILSAKEQVKVVVIDKYNTSVKADLNCNIGQIGKLLKFLKRHSVNKIFLLGALQRPNLSEIKYDFTGLKWALSLLSVFRSGDNALLAKLVELFNKNGIQVCSILGEQLLRQELLINIGERTDTKPSLKQLWDISKGLRLINLLSHMDIGQSVVVQQGLVLGVETIEGTASLLGRIPAVVRKGEAGVLVKAPKLGQSMEVDMPTIGLDTVEQAHHAGLGGIAIDYKNCLVLNKKLVIKKLNEYKMFLADTSDA